MRILLMAALIALATLSTAKADDIEYESLGPFDPSEMPFISDEDLEIIARHFVGDNKPEYTIAVCERGCWAVTWGGWSTQDRIRSVLQRCEHQAQEPCGLIAVNGQLVTFKHQPGQITYPEKFDSDVVPFVQRRESGKIRSQYANQRRHRALALNWNGSYGFSYGQSNKELARKNALALCRKISEGHGHCFLYDVNGTVVFKPTTDILGRD